MQQPVSIDLKKLLLTNVLQYFRNDLDGFYVTLNEMESAADKDNFISQGKRIVEQGWANEFNDVVSLGLFKPYLTDAVNTLKINPAHVNIAMHFVRQCIFKLLAQACIESPELNKDPQWFRQTRDTLNKEFERLCSENKNINYIYNGNRIYTLHDLNELARRNENQRDWGSSGTAAIVAFSLCVAMIKVYIERDSSPQIQRLIQGILALAVCLFAGNMFYQIYRSSQTAFFVNQGRAQIQQNQQQAQVNPQLMTDEVIKQHILVSEDDLIKLEAKASRPTPL